jgi:hypothetical protein
MYNRWYEFWWCWERSGILGFIDTGGASVHADVGLQNVVVGEELTLFSGKRNVVLGSKAGLSATRSEDNFLGWAAEAGDSNVIVEREPVNS